MPCCIRCPPVLSGITVCGTPCWPSSQAVSEAPWLRGRVSSTQTWTGMSGVMRQVDRRGRRAPVDRGQPAGVAVGQDIDALAVLLGRGDLLDQGKAVLADAPVDGDVLVGNLGGARVGRVGALRRRQRPQQRAHFVERPAQIDRGRPRRDQRLIGAVERGVGADPRASPAPCRTRRSRRSAARRAPAWSGSRPPPRRSSSDARRRNGAAAGAGRSR